LVFESNRKRKEEIKDEDVRKEVEKVKKRVEALERKLIGEHELLSYSLFLYDFGQIHAAV